MYKNSKKKPLKYKTIKLDAETHKRLRIYAAENDLWLWEAVRELLDKVRKGKR
jgi:hypothetical protein